MKIALAVLIVATLAAAEAGIPACNLVDPPGAILQAQKNSAKSTNSGPSVLVADKGKFRILLEGQPLGSEEFEIAPAGKDWMARGATTLRTPAGQTVDVQATLRLSPDGVPLGYEWSTKGSKKASSSIQFKNGVATVSLNLEGAKEPFVQELAFDSPRIAVLDNNLYHHFAILARLYDWNARGKQSFSVLIPQEITPGNISVEAAGPQQVDGATLELLRASTADLEIQLYVDSSHKLMRLAVPASKVIVIRE